MRDFIDIVENALSPAAQLVSRIEGMNLPASVRLNTLDAATVEIVDIRTDKPGTGSGRAAMTTIIQAADELGVTLEAWPMWDENVEGALPPEQLEQWYSRLGFKTIPNREPDSEMETDRYLVRQPGSK